MATVLQVENLSKYYRLGLIGRRTFQEDFKSWFAKIRGKPDPLLSSDLNNPISREDGYIWALRNIDFSVEEGEIIGIIGRNGAGKSTLLKIISNITAPTTGRVKMKGKLSSLLEVGTGFHPELTGRENVFLNGTILGMKWNEINRKYDEIVDFSGIKKFMDTPAKRYSSGMYVRLAFAVAAHLEPEIMLIDEVLAVGDVEFQKKCLGKMDDVVKQEGRTVLFVSHNMQAIQSLCPRTILIADGKVKEDGDTQQVITTYLSIGKDKQGERIWPNTKTAPGDEFVRLRAVRTLGPSDKTGSSFGIQEPWHIEIEFEVLSPGEKFNINLQVFNSLGVMVFAMGDYQTDEWQKRPRPIGIHRSRCLIPGNLCNEGLHRILVGIVTPPATIHALEDEALYVTIIDDFSNEGARGYYSASYPACAVRPFFKWDFDYES